MSIADRVGRAGAAGGGDQRLELFTGRHALIREFCTRLNSLQGCERMFFLYGDGGNGKSLLLRFLAWNRIGRSGWTSGGPPSPRTGNE